MELLIVGVFALIGIAFATILSPRIGIAAPLLLVVLGVVVSLVPGVPEIAVEPEVILSGILPPLLYAAAVSIPATDFRREFRSISGLSIALVLISTGVLGLFFHWVIGLSLPWALALGAIVSPTDPVATAIVKRLGVNPRVVTVLEGESMLNDAVALVLLRAAVAAAAASVTVWSVSFVFISALTIAVAIGWVVGRLNLLIRSRITEPVPSTVISFAVPFAAAIPAELLNASGLVAAVVAGLVTGHGAARTLLPQERQSDHTTWGALELVLEGSVYLIMGLELVGVIQEVEAEHEGVGRAFWLAAAALALALVVRAAFVAPLLWRLQRRSRRAERLQPRIADYRQRVEATDGPVAVPRVRLRDRIFPRSRSKEDMRRRLQRVEADISHVLSRPLGWKEGTIIVWAGMRGVVTIAAAQTLPRDTPSRALLVLIAFVVAVGSLLLQGGTVAGLLGRLKPAPGITPEERSQERERLDAILNEAAGEVRESWTDPGSEEGRHAFRLAVIRAQRDALLDVRDVGTFSSQVLSDELRRLDADQIRLEL